MSGDQLDLDLDLILWRAHEADTFGLSPATLETIVAEDIPALVAEVRRMRARFRLCEGCDATLVRCNEHIEAGAIKCCPDCKHADAP